MHKLIVLLVAGLAIAASSQQSMIKYDIFVDGQFNLSYGAGWWLNAAVSPGASAEIVSNDEDGGLCLKITATPDGSAHVCADGFFMRFSGGIINAKLKICGEGNFTMAFYWYDAKTNKYLGCSSCQTYCANSKSWQDVSMSFDLDKAPAGSDKGKNRLLCPKGPGKLAHRYVSLSSK